MTRTKLVSYAYPSSPNANKFKFKNGGYVVSVRDTEEPGLNHALLMFETEYQAYDYAERYLSDLFFDRYDMHTFENRKGRLA